MENILLIEDDDLMRKVLERILKSNGYSVETAIDGKDALHKISISFGKYDLIITDLMMPYSSGFEVISKAKSIEKSVAVMIISSLSDDDIVEDGKKMGASEYMKKPIMPGEFLLTVKRVLSSRIKV